MKLNRDKSLLSSFDGGGIILFEEVSHAIGAEKLIKQHNYQTKLVAPPLELRVGCDLALEINLVEQGGIERLLKEDDAPYMRIAELRPGSSELLNLVKIMDYGRWQAIRCGNMKLAYDKTNGMIVNISGGGCPDIPYLHVQLVGKRLSEAPRPKALGYTLCAVMLDRAFEEALNLFKGSA